MQVRARVIGYIPLEGRQRAKTRMSKLVDVTRVKSDGDRLKKLIAAAKAFNHCDTAKHDSDIKAGAVAVICSILRSCAPSFIANSKEIQHCLTILLHLYRCSAERLRASFCTDGATLVLDLLELIEINYRLGRKGDPKSLVLAQRVVDKLTSVARVNLTMVNRHEELLATLVGNITGVTGRFVMHLSLKIVASLSEHSQNKRTMFVFPGLMESIEVGSTHMCEAVREESARIIMNIAMEGKNKAELIQGDNQHWLDVVLALMCGSSVSTSYALHTLGCLASIPENKTLMVHHKDGAIIGSLLGVASSRIAQSQLSINAARVLGSLTCQVTAAVVGSHPGLLLALSSLACRDDKPATLAVAAAMTIKKIATYVRPGDRCHEHLLRALVAISYARSTEVLKWAVKAYHEQASFPASRARMIGQKGLLSSVNMLSNDDNEFVRDHAREVLSALASDVASAKNLGVETVIRYANKLCENDACKHRMQPRCYSPSSVALFDFFDFDDFQQAANFC